MPPGNYTLFIIAWNNDSGTLLDPLSAAEAYACVGWSGPYVYTATANDTEAVFMPVAPFGIAGSAPEPSSLLKYRVGLFE